MKGYIVMGGWVEAGDTGKWKGRGGTLNVGVGQEDEGQMQELAWGRLVRGRIGAEEKYR